MNKGSRFQRMFDSALFVRAARTGMLLLTLVGVPLATIAINRLLSKGDKVIEKVDATARQVELLQQAVRLGDNRRDEQIRGLATELRDHEDRIRSLEREASFPRASKP